MTASSIDARAGSFSEADRALILLTLANPSAAEVSQVAALFARAIDWADLSAKVAHNDVAPIVHLNLTRHDLGAPVPGSLRDEWRARHETIRARNGARWQKAVELFSHLEAAGVPVIVLKGGRFAESVYGDVGYKKMNDLDLLVRFADLEAVQRTYRSLDLVPLALLDGADKVSEDKGYHLPAHVSRDLTFVLGTHWNLCNPKHGYRFDRSRLWERSVELQFGGRTVRSLSPADVLHHLIVHFHYYKTGLKELADFANWIRANPGLDWEAVAREVDLAHTWTPAFRTLTLVETLYDCSIPSGLLEACRRRCDPWVATDTARLAARKDLLLVSRSVYGSEIEKAYLAFTYERRFGRKLPWFFAFWKRLLFPPVAVLCRTNGCAPGERGVCGLWLANLVRTAREVGQSYGMFVFLLLMLKSTAELAGSLVDAGVDPMAGLRRELGVDDRRIWQLLDSME